MQRIMELGFVAFGERRLCVLILPRMAVLKIVGYRQRID